MKLSEQDAKLFFDLMWPLQYFVNKKLKIHTSIKSIDEYAESTDEEKLEVRNLLYADTNLIDSFVKENPQHLSGDKLSIITNWKNFIQGDFFIERLLKKCAIFIKERDVYGVLGLTQGFDELIPRSRIPLSVRTVLLPFKGKIIHDDLFQIYNIIFGGGTKRSLRENYMTAKQNNRIIVSLDPITTGLQKEKSSKPLKNWKTELNELADIAKKLRGSSEHPAIYGPAFSLVKASIEFSQTAATDSGDLDHLYKSLKKVERALNKSRTVLNRVENW